MIARLVSKLWAWWWGPSLTAGEAVDRIRDTLSREIAESSPIGAEMDALADHARVTLERCGNMNPSAFDRRRDRRIGDARSTEQPIAGGLDVTEYIFDGVQRRNADIAYTERSAPRPDVSANTLPIYPKPADLPEGGAA